MMPVNAIKFRIEKRADGTIHILKPRVLSRQLKALEIGVYDCIVQELSTQLQTIKAYYFTMEGHLASHLGITKNDLHASIKHSTRLGRVIDRTTGEEAYESISDVSSEERMMERIVEFQQWAAMEFDYTFEPYKTDAYDTLGPPELPLYPEPPTGD